MQTFMGVHDHRVRQFYPAETVPDHIAQDKEAAVGRIHMEPQPMGACDCADPLQIVHVAQVRSAGRTHHQPRIESCCLVGADHLRQCVRIHAELCVGRHGAHDTTTQAGDMQGFGDAMVGEPGVIHYRPRVILSFQAMGFPGRYQTGQGGDAAARGEYAFRRIRGVAHQLRHPVQQLVFHAHGAGGT